MSEQPVNERKYWLDNPKNVNKIVWAVVLICIVLAGLDFTYHKHGHYNFETWPAFHGLFGFVSYVGLVLVAKQLRRFLKRDEDFYD